MFNSISKMLKEELDVLFMLLFEETESDFYKAYKNARIIVDYSGRGPSDSSESSITPYNEPKE